jgi:hypothetical protein
MQPHPWIVELAIRDEQERERRLRRQADREGSIVPVVRRSQLVRRCRCAIAHLLITVGESLARTGSAEAPLPSPSGQTATR